jgi:hypothetical protein
VCVAIGSRGSRSRVYILYVPHLSSEKVDCGTKLLRQETYAIGYSSSREMTIPRPESPPHSDR